MNSVSLIGILTILIIFFALIVLGKVLAHLISIFVLVFIIVAVVYVVFGNNKFIKH